jgi:hypothetical protein
MTLITEATARGSLSCWATPHQHHRRHLGHVAQQAEAAALDMITDALRTD